MNNRNVVTFDEYDNVFEWDEAKAHDNLRKHGISFQTAMRVFADPHGVLEDDWFTDGEQRLHFIGSLRQSLVVTVVHVVRKQGVHEYIRIISARRAVKEERNRYEVAHGAL